MPDAETIGQLKGSRGCPTGLPRAAGIVVLGWLAAGCLRSDPPILSAETAAQVGAIDLEMPPAKPAVPAPADTPPAPPETAPSQPPVALPEAMIAPGPDRIEVSLADVREAALHNNLDIEVEQVRPALARENTAQAEARFEPTGFARYTHARLDLPGIRRARLASRTETDAAEIGIDLPLQTGGTATINLPVTRTDSNTPGLGDAYDTAAGFSISQPLLRDAGIALNQAPITIARLGERQQDARTKLAILNVLANAERTYWALYAAARSVAVRLEQYERARTQEHQAIRLAEEGVVPSIEVTRARAGVSRRIEDIIVAENARRQTERELKRVMNRPELPLGSTTALIAIATPDPRELALDQPRALDTAYANRMELLDLELQMAIDALTVDIERNARLPALAVDYSFKYLGAAPRFDDAFDQIGDAHYADQAMGLSLEIPLGNAARKARFRRAVLQRALTETTSDQQRQLIERQVLDAIDQIEEAWQRILASREETLLAAATYTAEQRQFLAGSRTSTDVLLAADFLADAQLREVNALATYEIAKIDLAFVTGTMLGSGKVELQPYAGRQAPMARAAARPSTADVEQRVANKLTALGVTAPAQDGETAADVAPPAPPANAAAGSTPPTPDDLISSDSIGPVTETDTLWSIARAHRPHGDISVPDMMLALVRANPAAFVDGDPARMRSGVRLRLPSAAEITLPADQTSDAAP